MRLVMFKVTNLPAVAKTLEIEFIVLLAYMGGIRQSSNLKCTVSCQDPFKSI